jgi:hypothetical protein
LKISLQILPGVKTLFLRVVGRFDFVNPAGGENNIFHHSRFSFGNPGGAENNVFKHARFNFVNSNFFVNIL